MSKLELVDANDPELDCLVRVVRWSSSLDNDIAAMAGPSTSCADVDDAASEADEVDSSEISAVTSPPFSLIQRV